MVYVGELWKVKNLKHFGRDKDIMKCRKRGRAESNKLKCCGSRLGSGTIF